MKMTTNVIYFATALFAFACFALLPRAQAVSPAPDGGYPGGNTAEGQNALFSLTTGSYNTAVGLSSLRSNTEGKYSTAIGAYALFANTADENTSVGAGALLSNTTGSPNTATGAFALFSNTTGNRNTANGTRALQNNTTGSYNAAVGERALFDNTEGSSNTAVGDLALEANTTGAANTAIGSGALNENVDGTANTATGTAALLLNHHGNNNTADGYWALQENDNGDNNTAVGYYALVTSSGNNNTATGFSALSGNIEGNQNTAIGSEALLNSNANNNTAVGRRALQNTTTGSNNTAVGDSAGSDLTTGDNNIDIGYDVVGVADESNTIRIGNTEVIDTFIRGISGATASGGAAVFVNGNGKLGTMTSSKRFKDQIKPMDRASEAILALRPVSFRYKKEIDPQSIPQFGLVAEEVEKVSPDLVIRDVDGRPQTVRYEQINAMLLNEFLKAHRKIQEQEATITQLKKEMEALVAHAEEQDSRIQKVSDQIGINKARPRVVRNDLQRKESNTTPQ
jgi:trimeric autotransporter adhesin